MQILQGRSRRDLINGDYTMARRGCDPYKILPLILHNDTIQRPCRTTGGKIAFYIAVLNSGEGLWRNCFAKVAVEFCENIYERGFVDALFSFMLCVKLIGIEGCDIFISL